MNIFKKKCKNHINCKDYTEHRAITYCQKCAIKKFKKIKFK